MSFRPLAPIDYSATEIATSLGLKSARAVEIGIQKLVKGGHLAKPRQGQVHIPLQQDMQGVNLSGQDLSGLDLQGVNLSRANLRGCNLSTARLRGARLIEADLREVDLRNADLREVTAFAADLRGGNLAGGRSDGAAWALADCRDVIWDGHRCQNLFDHREQNAGMVLDEGILKAIGLNNHRQALAIAMRRILGRTPQAELSRGRLLLMGEGCHQRQLEQIGGYFPAELRTFVEAGRGLAMAGEFDPGVTIQNDIELRILRARLEGRPWAVDLQPLVDIAPNRLWRAWLQWQQGGTSALTRLFRSPKDLEREAGTYQSYPDRLTVDTGIRPTEPPDLPPEQTRNLRLVVEQLDPLSPTLLGTWMRSLCGGNYGDKASRGPAGQNDALLSAGVRA